MSRSEVEPALGSTGSSATTYGEVVGGVADVADAGQARECRDDRDGVVVAGAPCARGSCLPTAVCEGVDGNRY